MTTLSTMAHTPQKDLNFYDLTAVSLSGQQINMSDYKGKYVLIVNTASKCGYTSQYAGLESLYKKYKDQGLAILGFPCNQFGRQESGDEKSIAEGCVLNYGVTFQMFSKIKVNGKEEHPIYTFLKSQEKGMIKWNFTKFLIDPTGKVIRRYGSAVTPETIEKDIYPLIIAL